MQKNFKTVIVCLFIGSLIMVLISVTVSPVHLKPVCMDIAVGLGAATLLQFVAYIIKPGLFKDKSKDPGL